MTRLILTSCGLCGRETKASARDAVAVCRQCKATKERSGSVTKKCQECGSTTGSFALNENTGLYRCDRCGSPESSQRGTCPFCNETARLSFDSTTLRWACGACTRTWGDQSPAAQRVAEATANDMARYKAKLAEAQRTGKCPFCDSTYVTIGATRNRCEACDSSWERRDGAAPDLLSGLTETQKAAVRDRVFGDPWEMPVPELTMKTEPKTTAQRRFGNLSKRLASRTDNESDTDATEKGDDS